MKKLKGLGAREKRWRALPQRLFSNVAARVPGVPARFRNALAQAVAAPASELLHYAIPFKLAERALGQTAIIDADPQSIDRWLISAARSEDGIELPREHFLVDGPLKPLIRALDSSRLDQEVREFIACGGDYRQTRTFRTFEKRLSEKGKFQRNGVTFQDLADVEAYCRHHIGLIESIRTHGVVRRAQLASIGASPRRSSPNGRFLDRTETDAGVAVGPSGQLLRYRGGFHRTAAARELRLTRMPVQVKLVHLTWLRKLVQETDLSPHDALIEGLKRLSASATRP